MQVEPTRLVELAATSEVILASMVQDWASALDDLSGACLSLGDATGARELAASYADSLADADEVVSALAGAVGLGLAALVDAAQDALRADDAVADDLDRTAHHGAHGAHGGFGRGRGRGGH